MIRITLLFGAILLCVGTFAQLGYYYNEEFVELETNDKAPYLVITYNEESRNVIESKLADQASIENTNPTCRRISPSLPGMTLTPSFPSNTPGYTMTRVSETEIRVSLPPSGFMTVAATGSGCDNFTLTFAASTRSSYSLNICGDGSQMEVSLEPTEEVLSTGNAVNEQEPKEEVSWTLEVYETTKAELTASQKVTGLRTTIDTSRWKPGLYIVRALIGDETITGKINLK